MSVLAVVSKAVFEKEARVGGKLVGLGVVWPTALYASQNPGLESLASGGALFLATVRPGDQLWLVGVLEAPKKDSKGWSARANTTPVRDITRLMPKLRFSTGKGITAEPGKLGMSLQTPRQLTAEDEALLRGSPSTSTSAPAPTPTSSSPSTLEWKLDHYRRRALTTKLTTREAELLDSMMGLLEANDEDEAGIELADVIDTASGKTVALLALWPLEAGFLVDTATGEALADIYELTFDAHGDAALRARMKAAFEASPIRFDDPPRGFDGKRDTPKQAATPAAAPAGDDPAFLAEIAALHAELDASKSKKRDVNEAMKRLGAFQLKLLGQGPRPYPKLRPFELTATQRAWLALAYEHHESRLDLAHWGLPWKGAQHEERAPGYAGSPLARMLGKKPPLALDTTLPLDGHPHPLWAIFNDVVVGLRPESAFLDAILGQPLAVREGAWRQLASGEDRLGGIHPRNQKELQRGWAEPKDVEAAVERYQRIVRAIFDSLGDRGEQAALDVLALPVPESVYERGYSDPLRAAALEGLARRAKAAGRELDPKYDAAIAALVKVRESGKWLVPLFSLLPPERAGELTGLAYFLVEACPSIGGLERVVAEVVRSEESPKGSFVKLAAQLAAKFPDAALPLLKKAKPKLKRFPDSLDKAIDAAEKALAKSAMKATKSTPKPKKK